MSPPLTPIFSPSPRDIHHFSRIDSHVKLLPHDAATLTTLPLEMREKPAAEIIKYILDLKKDSSVALPPSPTQKEKDALVASLTAQKDTFPVLPPIPCEFSL